MQSVILPLYAISYNSSICNQLSFLYMQSVILPLYAISYNSSICNQLSFLYMQSVILPLYAISYPSSICNQLSFFYMWTSQCVPFNLREPMKELCFYHAKACYSFHSNMANAVSTTISYCKQLRSYNVLLKLQHPF